MAPAAAVPGPRPLTDRRHVLVECTNQGEEYVVTRVRRLPPLGRVRAMVHWRGHPAQTGAGGPARRRRSRSPVAFGRDAREDAGSRRFGYSLRNGAVLRRQGAARRTEARIRTSGWTPGACREGVICDRHRRRHYCGHLRRPERPSGKAFRQILTGKSDALRTRVAGSLPTGDQSTKNQETNTNGNQKELHVPTQESAPELGSDRVPMSSSTVPFNLYCLVRDNKGSP